MSKNTASPPLGWDDVYIVITQDGSQTLYSRRFEASYHSIYGAVAESKHVFIQHGITTQIAKKPIRVLEFGFGTGLNAFLSYIFAIKSEAAVDYTGIESNPIAIQVANQLDYPAYLAFQEEREIFLRMHSESDFNTGAFQFHLFESSDDIAKTEKFDCIFFDAFAPGVQPELWEQSVFDKMFEWTSDLGCLVTYCAQGEVRRRMTKAGFKVERLSGPPGKREMLRAVKSTTESQPA
jgi:tRNA U34 5-methylaminomethyl-2-thiouridine-forming methyltransferase MnmC